MGRYVETDKIGKVWVSDVDDWFASLSNLISECRNYTVSEIRFQEILKKHNERVRADVINAIKNDLHKLLTKEMNNPYQDQGLCQGLHCGIQLCDWYLDDSKE